MGKSLLEDRTISKRFLFPREKHFPEPYLISTAHNKLSCYRRIVNDKKLMIIVFHASNEVVYDYLEIFASEIESMGFNLLIAEYPGYSLSTGSASLINIIEEIPYIIRNCGIPEDKLVVFGRSLGTAYAVNTVNLFPAIKGLILESGIADFYERLDRRVSPEDIDTTEQVLRTEVLKYFNIEEHLKSYKGSTLIMHTQEDRIINVRHAKQNYEWANEPKELILFEEGDHSDIQYSNRQEYFKAINNFMLKL
ncbi:MAG: hypothetical protein U0W24_18435 [Bacteroidales bacterium]